ncbi:MAG: type VI secretion system ATPase TssH, partial [Lentisphaeria bacterium]|nr:type VI secretion system ATPase TssH [Lentisphaeria bacterium]
MNAEKFTNKAREALQSACQLVTARSGNEIRNIHLLAALVRQSDGLVPAILERLGVNPALFDGKLEDALRALPRVSNPGELYNSGEFNRLLVDAERQMKQMQDEYLSVEHLLLALASDGGVCGKLLSEAGADPAKILTALQQIRGNQRITSADPENTFDALNKYARDLTQLAMQDKLDPVIGRDDEIRRVIQILSRRTKNNPVLIGEPGVG